MSFLVQVETTPLLWSCASVHGVTCLFALNAEHFSAVLFAMTFFVTLVTSTVEGLGLGTISGVMAFLSTVATCLSSFGGPVCVEPRKIYLSFLSPLHRASNPGS